jgi:hypothetical protein
MQNQKLVLYLVPRGYHELFYFKRLKAQLEMNSSEECRYEFSSACYFNREGEEKSGGLVIVDKELQVVDTGPMGLTREKIFKAGLEYLTDIPKPEYSSDKTNPLITVEIKAFKNLPPFKILASDFYHLINTIKRYRLTPKNKADSPEAKKKKVLRTLATIIPWNSNVILTYKTYPMILVDKEPKIFIDFAFDKANGNIELRQNGNLMETFNYSEIYHMSSNMDVLKKDLAKIEIWFKKNKKIYNYLMLVDTDRPAEPDDKKTSKDKEGSPTKSIELDGRPAGAVFSDRQLGLLEVKGKSSSGKYGQSSENFIKDFETFLYGSHSKVWGKNPCFDSENIFKFDVDVNGIRQILAIDVTPPDEYKDGKRSTVTEDHEIKAHSKQKITLKEPDQNYENISMLVQEMLRVNFKTGPDTMTFSDNKGKKTSVKFDTRRHYIYIKNLLYDIKVVYLLN